MNAVHQIVGANNGYTLTRHAWSRMGGRSISPDAVAMVLDYGHLVREKGAAHYVVRRKEVKRYKRQGIELAAFEGIHVLCSAGEEVVMTAYRNKNMKSLRPVMRRRRGRR